MPKMLRVGPCTFRTLSDPLSGILCVKGGSSLTGKRAWQSPAKGTSPRSCAGSDDGGGPTDGESAHTSAARAAGPSPSADPASTSGSATKRAAKEGEQWAGKIEYPEAELVPATPLPKNGQDFVREVNLEVQMVAVAKRMLTHEDIKVSLKVFQQLLGIAYGKSTRAKNEKVRTYINDLPEAIRD